jgi:ribosomal protein L11 methyltransferase
MKKFIQIEIECSSTEAAEILVANLSEVDFYAFEQIENILFAFIKEDDFVEEKFKIILPAGTVYRHSVIVDKNWNQKWESELQPVRIKNFAGIRASFHKPFTDVAHDIIITPKMSFGTGHHATTFLMISVMEQIDFTNTTVLDFGTGSGVLAILAEKMGASSVIAIDYDEWSINNAEENVKANNCKNIFIQKRDNIIGLSRVDIILANINLNVLKGNAQALSTLLNKDAILIISGFLLKDEEEIVSVFNENGFKKNETFEKDGWLALLLQKY